MLYSTRDFSVMTTTKEMRKKIIKKIKSLNNTTEVWEDLSYMFTYIYQDYHIIVEGVCNFLCKRNNSDDYEKYKKFVVPAIRTSKAEYFERLDMFINKEEWIEICKTIMLKTARQFDDEDVKWFYDYQFSENK